MSADSDFSITITRRALEVFTKSGDFTVNLNVICRRMITIILPPILLLRLKSLSKDLGLTISLGEKLLTLNSTKSL